MMRCTASSPITSISPSHSARQGLYVIALQQQLRDFIRDATAARPHVKPTCAVPQVLDQRALQLASGCLRRVISAATPARRPQRARE